MDERSIGGRFLEDALYEFRKSRRLAEKAMTQVSDEEYFATLDPEANSIAILVKHMTGNMRSRWTDFLTEDGEKPDRNRDAEFVIGPEDTREALSTRWEACWKLVNDAVGSLNETDLDRTVMIRGEPHSVLQAINRQLTHYAYHAGQIVLLAKHFRSENWKTLSIARGASDAYNAEMARRRPKA